MHSKNNRLNTDFQIVYFLVGSCHTADGAYALLCDLEEDRESALGAVRASALRTEAKRVKAERDVQDEDEVIRLNALADLSEIKASKKLTEKNIAAADRELEMIQKCKRLLEPHRRFVNLPLHEAHEAAQREEWRLEFINRAENYLLTGGGYIPPDQYAAMRRHPDFLTIIEPSIELTKGAIRTDQSRRDFLRKSEKQSIPNTLLLNLIKEEVEKLEATQHGHPN